MKRTFAVAIVLVAATITLGTLTIAADTSETSPAKARQAERAAKKAAKKAAPAREVKLPDDLKIINDIVFKQVGDKKLDMMLFMPLEKKFDKSPLVVYIHGGGWGGGDKYRVLKNTYLNVIRELNKQGVTCASIEYRLTSDQVSSAYDAAADCKDAVRYLVKHASEYGIDPERIGTFGTSAGGHLTLVTALGDDRNYPCDPSLDLSAGSSLKGKIRCVAAYYPLVSLIDSSVMNDSNFENPERLTPLLGGPISENRDIAMKLSPIELLRSDSPAIFVAHGDQDKALPSTNATALRDAAQAKGVPVECIVSKGAGHGFSGKDIDPTADEINRRTVAFFMKCLTAR